jgi:hypothetical protein
VGVRGQASARHPERIAADSVDTCKLGATLLRPKVTTLSVFYGYPEALVAQWCGVSVATARAWKQGRRKPSRPALRLFTLHRDRRVLGKEWKDWVIERGTIVDPAGIATTVAQLEHFAFILQYASYLASLSPETQAEFQRLLRR